MVGGDDTATGTGIISSEYTGARMPATLMTSAIEVIE
jgi:hypothetical protein